LLGDFETDVVRKKIVATGSILVEYKFVRNCGKVNFQYSFLNLNLWICVQEKWIDKMLQSFWFFCLHEKFIHMLKPQTLGLSKIS
jgi:hypothetical protein